MRLFDDTAPTPVLEVNLRRLLLRCEQRQRESSRRRQRRTAAPSAHGNGEPSAAPGLQRGEAQAKAAGPDPHEPPDRTRLLEQQCDAMKDMLGELRERKRVAAQTQQSLKEQRGQVSAGDEARPDDEDLRLLAQRCNRMIGILRAEVNMSRQDHQPGAGDGKKTSTDLPESQDALRSYSLAHRLPDDHLPPTSSREHIHGSVGSNSRSSDTNYGHHKSRHPQRSQYRRKSSKSRSLAFRRELMSWKSELGLLGGGSGDEVEGTEKHLEHTKNALEEDLLETTSSLKALANTSKEAIQEDLERIERTKDMADKNLDKVEKLTKRTKKNTKAAWGGFMTEVLLLVSAAGMTAGVVLIMRIPGFGKNW
eukprot:g3143.t1